MIQGKASYLPCAIIYDRLDIAIWNRGEHVIKALWRLASFKGPITVTVIALEPSSPELDANATKLAVETCDRMAAVIAKHRP